MKNMRINKLLEKRLENKDFISGMRIGIYTVVLFIEKHFQPIEGSETMKIHDFAFNSVETLSNRIKNKTMKKEPNEKNKIKKNKIKKRKTNKKSSKK
jgi:hypothetical protein